MANRSHLPAAWRKSGLSRRAFCEREGIRPATSAYWRRKELVSGERRGKASPPAPPPSFTEALVAPEPATAPRPARAIEVTYPDGTRVRIPVPA